jgi:hypothetical protein
MTVEPQRDAVDNDPGSVAEVHEAVYVGDPQGQRPYATAVVIFGYLYDVSGANRDEAVHD